MNTTVRDLQAIFEVGPLGGLSDGQLMDRFIARREEAVFRAMIHRHGPMVWGVCRRVLRDHHDAEDAFQATFLVFARKAPSVKVVEKIGNWLYGVAYQTSTKARAMRARRRAKEKQVSDMPEPMVVPQDLRDALAETLDRELSRMPEKYRILIVLCELEGVAHKEAADRLGWPIGTVSGRLSRARAILSRRLTSGGMPTSVGALAVLLARESASASMPIRLIGPMSQAANLIEAGRAVTAGVVSAEVMTLMEGVVKSMLLGQLKNTLMFLAMVLAGTAVVGTGIVKMTYKVAAAGKEAIPQIPVGVVQAEKEAIKKDSKASTPAAPQDQKGIEDAFSKWTYPDATPYKVARSTSNVPSVLTDTGEYSTVAPFHEVVRFYVEKSGFEPPNWSILGRRFPGDTINMPGSWSQWGKSKALSIHHHIRPESASAGVLMTDFDSDEVISITISSGLGDKKTYIQVARHWR